MKGKKLATLVTVVMIGLNVTLPVSVALANETNLTESALVNENIEINSYLDLAYDGSEQIIDVVNGMQLILYSWKNELQKEIVAKLIVTDTSNQITEQDIEITVNNEVATYNFSEMDSIQIAAQKAEEFSFEERQISAHPTHVFLPVDINSEGSTKERLALIDEFETILEWLEEYRYMNSDRGEISEEEYLLINEKETVIKEDTSTEESHNVEEYPETEKEQLESTPVAEEEEEEEEIAIEEVESVELPKVQIFSTMEKTMTIAQEPSIIYSTHVQSKGWLPEVKDSQTSGALGENKRIEALKIRIENGSNLGISYSTHVQSFGWMSPVSDNTMSGTENLAKRVEAIKINLTGSQASDYDIYYRAHVEKIGWLDWAKNGEPAGTEGLALRIEGLEVKLVKKGEAVPSNTTNYFVQTPGVWYSSFVEEVGWQEPIVNGLISGTEGQQKSLEAINLGINTHSGLGLRYMTHMQSYGWTDWTNDNQSSGLPGANKRMEAMRIELTGANANYFDIYYRVHSRKFGWLGWAKNGEVAGTEGYGYRSEAYQVKVVPKGTKVNLEGPAYKIKDRTSVAYNSHVQKLGWIGVSKNGKMNGTQGRALRLEALAISLEHDRYSGDISYTTHVQKYGWVSPTKNGEINGTTGEAKRLEAVRINLNGEIAQYYDIYYRAYVQTYGWLGWAKNGMSAGTEGLGKRLESVEIKLIEKGLPAPHTTEETSFRKPAKKKIVFLDIGHGGADSGARYYGVNEKDLNLQIGLKVQRDLEKAGYAVILSRNTDTFIDHKTERSRIANGSGADIFISLHNNAMPGNSYVNGIETFYYENDPNYVPKINKDMHNNPDRLIKSSVLANAIHNNLINHTGAYDRGVKRDTFAVLRETALPAVLLEFGFMSNSSELNKLKTDSYQNTLSKAVTNGVKSYFTTY